MFKLMAQKPVVMFKIVCLFLFLTGLQIHGQDISAYRAETDIVFCTVAGNDLKLNAFIPTNATTPEPAIVEIHGGWWFGGEVAKKVGGVGGWQFFMRRNLAIFSIQYRLGEAGGFPQNIRDCRNAI